jgi:hypothetical protein
MKSRAGGLGSRTLFRPTLHERAGQVSGGMSLIAAVALAGYCLPAGFLAGEDRTTGATPRIGIRMEVPARFERSDTAPGTSNLDDGSIARALRAIAACRARYCEVSDYTCTLRKRERINGRLLPAQVMALKVRTRPHSIYLKFLQPESSAGREAIYIEGQNEGRVIAHDVGLAKLITGTMRLDPACALAMEDCRHPITEAGIGPLIAAVAQRWAAELRPGESLVQIEPEAQVGDRPCTLIISTHSAKKPEFLFYQVRLAIDTRLGLPIHFEAYDWPRQPGAEPELVEEYTYADLRLNAGLDDSDFDPDNAAYAYGRF